MLIAPSSYFCVISTPSEYRQIFVAISSGKVRPGPKSKILPLATGTAAHNKILVYILVTVVLVGYCHVLKITSTGKLSDLNKISTGK